MGQALAQMPQAMHLLGAAAPGAMTITCMGQASTHLPQPTHFFLSIRGRGYRRSEPGFGGF